MKLGELAEGEASDLVGKPRNGHAFSSNEVEQILALAGRHPYWLNYLCAQAYEAKQAGRLDRKAFDAIEARLNEERRMAEAIRTGEAEDAQPANAALETQTTGAPGVKDPNAPLRWSLILTLLSLAIGGFSALSTNPPGLYLALVVLGASLVLLLIQAVKGGRPR